MQKNAIRFAIVTVTVTELFYLNIVLLIYDIYTDTETEPTEPIDRSDTKSDEQAEAEQ